MSPPPIRSALPRSLARAVLASLVLLAPPVGLWAVRLNLSPSAPAGLWLRAPGQPGRGDWVMACLPPPVAEFGRLRGYHPEGPPLGACRDGSLRVLKQAVALPGDRVEVTARGVVVNGGLLPGTAPLSRDSQRRPLPRFPPGPYRLRPGEVWLLSGHIPNSWDSRYYGPVGRASVVSRMVLAVPF
jgi:conjugative transfer signal peptidase TraF